MGDRDSAWSDEDVLIVAKALLVLGAAAYVAVAGPALLWSLLHGDPTLLTPAECVAAYRDPGGTPGVPPLAFVVASWLAALLGLASLALRRDALRSRAVIGLPAWRPRAKVTARPWARPRDLLHLQPRDGSLNGRLAALLGALRGRRDRPEPVGGDSWLLGSLAGRPLRSLPESHLMAVAPTRSGKTTRVLIPSLVEHAGPAVVLVNKTEVVHETLDARRRVGPVSIFAPTSSALCESEFACGWSPLIGCEKWEQALRMGRWLFDADPSASAVANDSGGARFYNREAIGTALPPLIHAATLEGLSMAAVLEWLRSGVDALDEPRTILSRRGSPAAEQAVAGIQAYDERPRSLLLMSAAQLIDAYRFPSVQRFDRADFRADRSFDTGTLYVVVPDSDQELLAPLVGGLLGSLLRTREQRAATGQPSGPHLRVLADEAAHLAPLGRLPTYLAVSAGWNVRWCLIYQSLSQLQRRYGAEADAVLGNVLCKLFLGPIQDATTRRYIVDLLGDEPVTETSRRRGVAGDVGERTEHERRAPKASAQQLQQLEVGEAVLVHGRDLPAVVRLKALWERR